MNAQTAFMFAIKASIALTVFSIGLRTSDGDLVYLLRKPGLFVRSLFAMYVIMPLVALSLAFALRVPTYVTVTLVAIAISPVPPILPIKATKSYGSSQFATSLLAMVALASVAIVPAAAELFGLAFDMKSSIHPMTIAEIVSISVLLPLIAGAAVRQFFPAIAARIARGVSVVGMVVLVLAVLPLLVKMIPTFGALMGNGTVIATGCICAIGLFVGHLLAGDDPADRTVLALSTATRHPAVAIAIATTVLPDEKRIPVLVLFSLIVSAIVSVPYVMHSKRVRAQPDAPPAKPMPSAPELNVPTQKAHYNSYRNRH
jgi:BASS family bile acid:Na+ symporter